MPDTSTLARLHEAITNRGKPLLKQFRDLDLNFTGIPEGTVTRAYASGVVLETFTEVVNKLRKKRATPLVSSPKRVKVRT